MSRGLRLLAILSESIFLQSKQAGRLQSRYQTQATNSNIKTDPYF